MVAAPDSVQGMTCGTIGGYAQHHRDNELACQSCKDATATYERNRRRKRGIRPRSLLECGTFSGYTAHYRKGDTPCRACMDAHNEYQRRYRAKVKLEKRRGSIPTVIADYIETYGPMELRELVLFIQLRHDIAELSIRRAANRMMKNGQLVRGVDIVTATPSVALPGRVATGQYGAYSVQPETGWVA